MKIITQLYPLLQVKEQVYKASDAGIDAIVARSKSVLSHYEGAALVNYLLKVSHLNLVPLQEYSQIFSRYQNRLNLLEFSLIEKIC